VDSHKEAFTGFLILLFDEGNNDDDDYGNKFNADIT